jgi:hypothetical protein
MTQYLNYHRQKNFTSVAANKYYLVFVTCLILGICGLSVVGSKVWKGIFRPKKEEIKRWRKLHTEVLHNIYFLHNIVMMIKSRRLKWARCDVCLGEMVNA